MHKLGGTFAETLLRIQLKDYVLPTIQREFAENEHLPEAAE